MWKSDAIATGMKVGYLYHSGLVFETEESILIVDYFQPENKAAILVPEIERILKSPKRIYVLVSHVHADHYDPIIWEWQKVHPEIRYLLSSDIRIQVGEMQNRVCYLSKGDSFSDGHVLVKAYGSTDEGVSYYICTEGWSFFHSGDLNNWHWNEESTADEIRESEDAYHKELNAIALDIQELDVLCFPIDIRLGKDYMKGAQEFISRIRVHYFVPIHFTSGGFNSVVPFASVAGRRGVSFWGIRKECEYLMINKK